MTRYTHKITSDFSDSPQADHAAAIRQTLTSVNSVVPPITVTAIYDDFGSVQGDLTPYSDHETSDDRTLTVSGTLSAPLGSGERIEIIDTFNNNAVVGVAVVSGDRWTATTSALAIGYVGLSARIVGANGNSRAEEFFWAGKIEDESAVLSAPTLTSVLGYSQDFGTGEAPDVITNGDVTTTHAFMLSGTTDLNVRVEVSVDGGATFLEAQTNGNAGANQTNWTFYTYLPAGIHDIIVRGSNGAGQFSEPVTWHFTVSNQLIGEDGANDTFVGYRTDSEFFDGRSGEDSINGGQGDDTVIGGQGNDMLVGGGDRDVVDGDEGSDTLRGALGADTLSGGDGNDNINGGADNDVIYGDTRSGVTPVNGVTASPGDDGIVGGNGDDTIYGGDGNDYLTGGRNQPTVVNGETIYGGDYVDGGAGDDVIYNSVGLLISGDDTLTGGAGNDRIVLQAAFFGKQIVSFADVLVLGAVDGVDRIENFQGNVFDSSSLIAEGYHGPIQNEQDYVDLSKLLDGLGYAHDAASRQNAWTIQASDRAGEIDLFVDTNAGAGTNLVLIAHIAVTAGTGTFGEDNVILL